MGRESWPKPNGNRERKTLNGNFLPPVTNVISSKEKDAKFSLNPMDDSDHQHSPKTEKSELSGKLQIHSFKYNNV